MEGLPSSSQHNENNNYEHRLATVELAFKEHEHRLKVIDQQAEAVARDINKQKLVLYGVYLADPHPSPDYCSSAFHLMRRSTPFQNMRRHSDKTALNVTTTSRDNSSRRDKFSQKTSVHSKQMGSSSEVQSSVITMLTRCAHASKIKLRKLQQPSHKGLRLLSFRSSCGQRSPD